MGKTSKNEIIKLRATFYNNTAVGLMVAGFAIPYISLLARIEYEVAISKSFEILKPEHFREYLLPIVGAGIALVVAWFLHSRALRILKGIQD